MIDHARISAPTCEQESKGNCKTFGHRSDQQAKLAGEASAMLMHNVVPKAVVLSCHPVYIASKN